MLSNTLHLLTATMTGTAEVIAEEIQASCKPTVDAKIELLATLKPEALSGIGHCLIISSTYGEGEVPTPALPFFESLLASNMDLSHVRYGVIALGDKGQYPNSFAAGGDLWDSHFARLGAQRVGQILRIDASTVSAPEELAVRWSNEWLSNLRNDSAGDHDAD